MAEPTLKSVVTNKAPAAIGPYSQGIAWGNLVFVSGQLPLDPASGNMVGGSIEERTHQVIKNIEAVLKAAGTDLNHVVKTTLFLTNIGDFSRVNEVYARYFSTHKPARSTVQVSALPKGSDIEMEAIGVRE